MIKSPLFICAAAAIPLLAACNHDDNFVDATPGGLYSGTLTATGASQQDGVYAIVDESGYGRMIDSTSGDYYQLGLGNNGLSLNGTFNEFPATAGSPTVAGTVKGNITEEGLTASFNQNTTKLSSLNVAFDFNYYNGSNLNVLAGNWKYDPGDGSFGITLGISSTGSFTGTDTNNCTYSGSFTIFDSFYDAYHVSYAQTCAGTVVNYSGVAAYYYADSQYPAGIELLADDGVSNYLAVQVLSSPADTGAVAVQPAAASRGTQRRPVPGVVLGGLVGR